MVAFRARPPCMDRAMPTSIVVELFGAPVQAL